MPILCNLWSLPKNEEGLDWQECQLADLHEDACPTPTYTQLKLLYKNHSYSQIRDRQKPQRPPLDK